MKELTKEQADWLIERFEKNRESTITIAGDVHEGARIYTQLVRRLEETINQCTEKPFPEFRMNAGKSSVDYIIGVGLDPYAGEIDLIDGGENLCGLTFSQFKTYAEKIAKVAEWLDAKNIKC